MSTNPRYSQYGGASSPSRGIGVYTGKITLIYNDGRVRVFINTFGRNIGPCRIINKSAGDAISLNDEVLCTYANDTSDELIVVGRLTERVDPVSESTSGLIVEASTTSELVRITQKGTGAALLVEDSTNPDSTPFIIDASGNVGIGVSSPAAKIDVSGAAVISGDLTVDTSTLKVDSSNNRVGIGTASPSVTLDISGATSISGDLTVDTTTLKVDSSNNRVGIGTASPSVTLDVSGAASISGNLTVDTTTFAVDAMNNRVGIGTVSPSTALQVVGTVTATAFAGPLTGNVTGNVSGTAATVTGAAQTSITSVGTLTGLTLSGTVTLPNSVNNQIYTSTTADSALPWANGPVLQGATGWSFYSAISASYRMGFRSNTAGTTKYFWTADSALIGEQPNDFDVTNTLNVMGTGRFTSTVTAPTFSGALSGNATSATKAGSLGSGGVSGTAMTFNWSGQGGQPPWLWGGSDGSNMYVYNPSNFSVNYSSSSGTASNVSGSGAAQVGYLMVTNNGIGYTGATIGGGANNLIGFRWANPSVNCTVDNVISAEAANFSDRRLKTNIVTYTGGLDAVRNLRPVTFNPLDIISFTDDGEPIVGDNDPYDEMLGFIADEVQEIIPSAISGTGKQLKSVSVLQVLSAAVSAIKELDAKVTSLMERIEALENK